MLTQLHLQNFKNWKDTKPVRLAPLTVLFGVNSSGKSSISQFMMMLKQTVESSDRKAVIFPGDANSPINLGSFEELIYGRDTKNKLEFSFEWELPERFRVIDSQSDAKFEGTKMRFQSKIGVGTSTSTALEVSKIEYELLDNSERQMQVSVERKMSRKSEYKLEASPYKLKRNPGRAWGLGPPSKFYGFPDQTLTYYQNAEFVQDFSLQLESLLRSVCYLGPLRSRAQRLYTWTGGEPESVGYAGEHTIRALLAAKDREISPGKKKHGKPFATFIAEKLKQMELIEDFEVKVISEHRKEYEVRVRAAGSPVAVDLPDVGFGISQVLPVLVQCFFAPPGSIVFIEQPELHLHPRAQAHLADVLIEALTARQGGSDRDIQLIIETHSEHLLHRIQRRIAENDARNRISNEMVAAYFAHTAQKKAVLEPLQIDIFGYITNWPDGFFGDSMEDLMQMSKAAAQRRMEQQGASN